MVLSPAKSDSVRRPITRQRQCPHDILGISPGQRTRIQGGARGFSLVEMEIVVVVALLILGIATPSFLRSWRIYRLSGVASSLAGILERDRYEAIKRNTTISYRTRQQGKTTVAWIDLNGNGAMDPGEAMIALPSDIQLLPAGVAPSPASMGFPNAQVPAGPITFDSRGTVNFGAGAPVVYVAYLGYPGQPQYGFRAVTVTPMGQTKVWSAAQNGPWHSP